MNIINTNKTPRKILMTADTIGGVWSYSIELAKSLARYDIQVCLATMGRALSDSQRNEVGDQYNIKLFESEYKLEWMDNPWDDVRRSGNWLLDIENKENPDIIHLNGFAHGSLAFKAHKLVVGHSCVFSWFEAVEGAMPPESFNLYRAKVMYGLQKADVVVAPSGAMLDELISFYGNVKNKRVIYNGRDPMNYLPAAKDPFVFCAARVWDKAKNVLILASIADQIPWRVRIAGDATAPDGLSDYYENVDFRGIISQQEVAFQMSKASIYAHPARYEPFGLSVLEAALSGCALVLGDIPSLREIWADNALFVPPNSSQELAEAINHLIYNKSIRKKYSSAARKRALNYTASSMGDAYYNLYKDMLV